MTWIPFAPEIATKETLKVSKTEIELQDLFADFDDMTVFSEDYLFDLQR